MTDIYIEDFYHDVAQTLLRLYAAFPRPTAVYVDEIAGQDSPDEYGLASERHRRCLGALQWLGEEGFLRYLDTIGNEAIDQAVLSLRGLRALHARPDNGAPMIEQLRGAVKARNSIATNRHIETLFTLFAGQGILLPSSPLRDPA